MRKNVRRVLAAVLLAVLAVSGGYIAWKSLDYQKGGEDYAEAVEVAGLELPEDCADQVLALLWEQGLVKREGLAIR